jgi:predicted amidohydrolase
MFDVEVGGRTYRESEHEEPGDEVVLSSTADGVELGLTVCYDLRFPELYRELAARGARILAVPAAFTLATTREHWEVLLRARAIEDQAFVVAANQVGEHAPGYRSGGRSMIVDPWGLVLAQAPDVETFAIADLDLDRQAEIRRTLPSLANRRLGAKPGSLLPSGGLGAKPGSLLPSGGLGAEPGSSLPSGGLGAKPGSLLPGGGLGTEAHA